MNRTAKVYFKEKMAGHLTETGEGYKFEYTKEYQQEKNNQSISKTLPLQEKEYTSKTLFAFFDGLIPEGWLLDIAQENWKLNYTDRMGLLMACCKDCIGAVSIEQENEKL